jgi:hypothetical protein
VAAAIRTGIRAQDRNPLARIPVARTPLKASAPRPLPLHLAYA